MKGFCDPTLAANGILSNYYRIYRCGCGPYQSPRASGQLHKSMMAFYVTDKKSGDMAILNKDNFYKKSLNDTKKEEMTFDAANTKDQVKFTTKDGAAYTLKKSGETFVVTNLEQK